MKVFAILTAMLMSQAALAYPTAGDYVKLSGTVSNNGTTVPVSLEIELVSYDSASKQFAVRSTTTIADQSSVEEGMAAETDFMAQADIQEILATCPQIGGTKARTSVPAGSFDVCTISEAKTTSTYSIGDVPFGIIRSESVTPEGAKTSLALESVRWGN